MLTAALGLIRRLGKSSSKSFEEELGSADGAVLFRSIYAAALRDSPAAALLCARHRRRRQHDPALIPVVFVLDRKPLPSTPFESCPGWTGPADADRLAWPGVSRAARRSPLTTHPRWHISAKPPVAFGRRAPRTPKDRQAMAA